MLKIYIAKVRDILGGYANDTEVEIVKVCFYRRLSPKQTAQVIINTSLAR